MQVTIYYEMLTMIMAPEAMSQHSHAQYLHVADDLTTTRQLAPRPSIGAQATMFYSCNMLCVP